MMPMLVLNMAVLAKFARKHRDAAGPLERWRETAQAANWTGIFDVRKVYPSADGVPVNFKGKAAVVATVFNIKGNDYRLITVIDFEGGAIVVREVLTHAEYNKNSWKGRL